MHPLEIVISIVLIVFSLLIIAVVLLQEGRQANLGAISGAADSLMEKSRARSIDEKLARWTGFFVLVFVGMLITQFVAL